MSLLLAVQDLENNYTTAELRIMAKHYRISPRTTREKMITDIAKANLGVANKKMSVQKASLPPVDKSGASVDENRKLVKQSIEDCGKRLTSQSKEIQLNIKEIITRYGELLRNGLLENVDRIQPDTFKKLLKKINCSLDEIVDCSHIELASIKEITDAIADEIRNATQSTRPEVETTELRKSGTAISETSTELRKPGTAISETSTELRKPGPARSTSTTSLIGDLTRTFDPSVEPKPAPRPAPPKSRKSLSGDASLTSLIGGIASDSGDKPTTQTLGSTTEPEPSTVPGLQPAVPATIAYVPLASDTATGDDESPELQRQSSLTESGQLVRPGSQEGTVTVQDILGECSNDEDCERLIGRSEIQELLRGQKVVCVKKVDGKNECVVAVVEK